jgi:hypothetical protein
MSTFEDDAERAAREAERGRRTGLSAHHARLSRDDASVGGEMPQVSSK